MFVPRYRISPAMLRSIKQITLLVHQLNQVRVTDVVLAKLQSEAEARATYASTTIEGNPLPLTEVRRLIKNAPEQIRDSEREVVNYNQALSQLHQQPRIEVNTVTIQQIHQTVMHALLPDFQVGRWRQHPNVVHDPRNGKLVYLPPDVQDVATLMEQLLHFVEQERGQLDPLLLAGLFHKQFILIHPFIDGNGRTVRLVTKLLLAGLGLNFFPLLSLENYYNRNISRYFQFVGEQGDYYKVIETLDFTAWLEYFVEGIRDELVRLEKQIRTFSASPDTRLATHHRAILDFIGEHGFITDRDYAQLTDRAKATRTLDFRKLMALGLVERFGQARGTYYKRKQ